MKTSKLINILQKLVEDYGDFKFAVDILNGEKFVCEDFICIDHEVSCILPEIINEELYMVLSVDCSGRK